MRLGSAPGRHCAPGDNPVEYWNEDEPAGPEPFDMAKVNAALAG
jgi:hypothetical protein